MKSLLYILIPLGLVGVYVLYQMVVGRSINRRALNVTVSLLLLGYFSVTAGLGIFWVASHQLPVFDMHYLVGYVTLVVVFIHVALNWQSLSAFFRRLSPKSLLEENGRGWRIGVGVVGRSVVLILYGVLFFWLGLRQGASRIEITMGKPSVVPPVSIASASILTGEQGKMMKPAVVKHQMVRDGVKERILADYYHEKTKHSRLSIMTKSGGLDWSSQPEVFKEYPGAEVIDLPEPGKSAGMSTGEAVESCRRSVSGFSRDSVSLADISTMLYMTNGVTGVLRYPRRTYYLRAAPSAGALYPAVTYIIARSVEGLSPGLYHYAVKEHKLHRLRTEETLNEDLAALVAEGHLVEQAPVTFIFSSIFFRSSWKYGERSYRYSLLDTGHLAVQAALSAGALGYASKPIGRFDDRRVNALFGLDEQKEGVLLIVPVGKVLDEQSSTAGRPAFDVVPNKLDDGKNPLIMLMHGNTYLGITGDTTQPFPTREPVFKSYLDLPVIPLPKDFQEGADIIPTIMKRRSARNWANRRMTLRQFASVLYYTFGIRQGDKHAFTDQSIQDNHALNLYLLVNDVEGLDPGVYYYIRQDHALAQIRRGDYRRQGHSMGLSQKVVGNAAVVPIMTIDLERIGYPDADRGYRYAIMDSGMLGGRLYLQTVGLGLGCCGIGAFFDDEVSDLIKVSPDKELIIYLAAIGVDAAGEKQ